MKKIFALLIAMVMVLGMSTAVFASTITIDPGTPTGGSGTPTYSYYLMMKATVNGEKVAYYVENETLASAIDKLKVGEDDLFTVTKASGADRWNISINKKADDSEFTGEEVAAALDTIKANAIDKKENSSELTYTFEGDGYVLVESSLGTKLVLDTITTKEIKEKNTYPSLEKTEDTSNAEIGGTVNYEIPVSIPANVAEKAITVTDIITKGLTLNTTISVTGAAADPAYTSATWTQSGDAAEDGSKTYTVTIPANVVKANAGGTITLKYSATVNENAVVNVPETNKAKLKYDNFTSVETEPVEVKTFGFDLLKIGDDNDENPLANVEFTLTNKAGNYYDATADSNPRFSAGEKIAKTDANGKITFAGLAAGEYTLTETKTNDGYNLLSGPITVTIDDKGTATFSGDGASTLEGNAVKINNQSGAVLPSTGGIGTTIFYIIGAILVVGAGVVLVTRRRMNVQ